LDVVIGVVAVAPGNFPKSCGGSQVPRTRTLGFFAAFAAFAFFVVTGCGKSGPPLPPLVKVPAPPADLLAERRGGIVDIQFTVPNTNTDGSRPANIDRVDVYGITTDASMTDDEIVKHGTRVAAVDVKAPRDPNQTVGPDESDAEVEAPEGTGLDQGALAHVSESLTSKTLEPVDPARDDKRRNRRTLEDRGGLLLGPPDAVLSRTYVVAGFSTRGRKGPASKRVAVPLVAAPPAPARPAVVYNETAVTVTWMPVTLSGLVQEPDAGDVLPSRPLGVPLPTVAYHVYDVPPQEGTRSANRLTAAPVAETAFEDVRMTWGERRCYSVRVVEVINTFTIEGEAAPAECKTLTDTFPPAAPKGLQAVANEGSISLIWDPSGDKDLAGYLVFRGTVPGDASQQLTPSPIDQAMFNEAVTRGVRYSYIVKAIDKAGNVSPASAPAEAMAR
jgi:hypothetical protein